MRLIAALMITAAFTMLGRYCEGRAQLRCRSVECIVVMLSTIRARLEFTCLPVAQLMETLCADARFASLPFIAQCDSDFARGKAFSQAWENAVRSSGGSCALKENDISLLCEFGAGIGTTDLSGQIGVCELYGGLFSDLLKRCTEAKSKRSGMLTQLGLLGGIAFSILLI